MGFPITAEHQAITLSNHTFSRGVHAPGCRTIRSQTTAIGNSMHVNAVGGCTLMIIALLPNLGTHAPIMEFSSSSPGSPRNRKPKRPPASAFSQAFQVLVKSKRVRRE
eukprot:1057653-Pyramimonas_sp.AAC.1